MMKIRPFDLILQLIILFFTYAGFSQTVPKIEIWYGHEQSFGQLGQAQRWINVLGSIRSSMSDVDLTYRLNDGESVALTLGPDQHRLAHPGDFNIEIDWSELSIGANELRIEGMDKFSWRDGVMVTILVEKEKSWPLPYRVDFSKVKDLQSVVQIVDGHWILTNDGVRTAEPYYDRVLAVGDTSWRDYEAHIQITIHDWTPSVPGPPTYNVTHYGTALRWRGHHADGRQPSRKWYPLGAQGEFLLKENTDSCQWRILFDGGRHKPKKFGEPQKQMRRGRRMHIKAQVLSLADGSTQYQFKQWMDEADEPTGWDVVGTEENDYPSGALCMVPHNSDVTVHQIEVIDISTQLKK